MIIMIMMMMMMMIIIMIMMMMIVIMMMIARLALSSTTQGDFPELQLRSVASLYQVNTKYNYDGDDDNDDDDDGVDDVDPEVINPKPSIYPHAPGRKYHLIAHCVGSLQQGE